MKTSLDISDHLFQQVKRLAHSSNVTVRALVEEGLRRVLEDRETRPAVKPKLLVFKGDGLTDEFVGASWSKVRDEIYR